MGFGAGSLVFTGLQIGAEIASGPFRAITPGARLLLVTAQMHFIFLNSKSLSLAKHTALAKLGLMHMIATNLCEWLQVSGTTMMKWRGKRKKRKKIEIKINKTGKHFSSRKSRRLFEQLDTFYPSKRCAFARKANQKRITGTRYLSHPSQFVASSSSSLLSNIDT